MQCGMCSLPLGRCKDSTHCSVRPYCMHFGIHPPRRGKSLPHYIPKITYLLCPSKPLPHFIPKFTDTGPPPRARRARGPGFCFDFLKK